MDWDHFEELDDASTWFFGSCHRKRIAGWHAGALAKAGGPTGPTMPVAAWSTSLRALSALSGREKVNRSWPDVISAVPGPR
jgi:hypothetical protein